MSTDQHLGLEPLIDTLKRKNSTCMVRWKKVKLYDINPWDFLSFAKQDLDESGDRGRINALSNAKRAIECRVDELLTLLNFRCFSSQHRWGLPYKLQVLKTFDISAPDILLHYITRNRNLLEHEYLRPSEPEQIRYIADIVELFLKASDQYGERGYITSATIRNPKEIHPETDDRIKTTSFVVMDEYKINFDLQDEVLDITHVELQEVTELLKKTSELRQWEQARVEKTKSSLTIRDCRQEDVRELMKLIRGKAD